MSVQHTSTSLRTNDATSISEDAQADETIRTAFTSGLGDVIAAEHPAVMGGRVGACVFSSLLFPAGLWALGAVDATGAALIATVATLLVTRPILLLGGTRIAGVLALEIATAALAFLSIFPVVPGLLFAAFFPLLGMLACVSAAAHVATFWLFADDRPYEADVAIARATQANVVDIRAAGIARRAGTKTPAPAASDLAEPTAQPHQQAR